MKGSVFVGFYSVILIGLFIVCCYLMSIVNPKPLPEELKKLDSVDSVYVRQPLPPIKKPNYGLEKIPEGVDADEFRRTTVTKYNFNSDPNAYERGQKVVPPVWPHEYKRIIESSNIKAEDKPNMKVFYQTSSPVKGHRRSVNDNKNHKQNNNSGTILLKIIDDSGRKKIEMKFIATEKNKKKDLTKNRESNKFNKTASFLFLDQSNNVKVIDGEDNALKINVSDEIVLTIHDVSDVVLDETLISTIERTETTKNVSVDSKHTGFYLNKTLNNNTNRKKVDIREKEKKPVEELKKKEIYILNLVSNSSGITVDEISNN